MSRTMDLRIAGSAEFRGNTYVPIENYMSFAQAAAMAQKENAMLATVEEIAELIAQDPEHSLFGKDLWTGTAGIYDRDSALIFDGSNSTQQYVAALASQSPEATRWSVNVNDQHIAQAIARVGNRRHSDLEYAMVVFGEGRKQFIDTLLGDTSDAYLRALKESGIINGNADLLTHRELNAHKYEITPVVFGHLSMCGTEIIVSGLYHSAMPVLRFTK